MTRSGQRRQPARLPRFAFSNIPGSAYASLSCLAISYNQDELQQDWDAEIKAMGETLSTRYHVKFQRWRITATGQQSCEAQVAAQTHGFVRQNDDADRLLIFYYGGHGDESPPKWFACGNGADLEVEHLVKAFILDVRADVLFIFDACCISSARQAFRTFKQTHVKHFANRNIYLLGASNGPTSRSQGLTDGEGDYTFTKMLTRVLRQDVENLHFEGPHELRSTICGLFDELGMPNDVSCDTIAKRQQGPSMQILPDYNKTFREIHNLVTKRFLRYVRKCVAGGHVVLMIYDSDRTRAEDYTRPLRCWEGPVVADPAKTFVSLSIAGHQICHSYCGTPIEGHMTIAGLVETKARRLGDKCAGDGLLVLHRYAYETERGNLSGYDTWRECQCANQGHKICVENDRRLLYSE